MKLAIGRTYFGNRLCFPDISPGRLVDVQAAYAWQLQGQGDCRDDAIARSQREIPPELPALLQAAVFIAANRKANDVAAWKTLLTAACIFVIANRLCPF